jgi:hypothetical protein
MTNPIPGPLVVITPDPQQKSASFLRTMDRVLYPITLGYTSVIFLFQIYEFAMAGAYRPRYEFGDVYLALLTAYAAQREGAKWLGADEAEIRIRRGEIFIGLWFALYLAIIACSNLSLRWVLPQELKRITLGVLGVFAVTGVSAGLRRSRDNSSASGGNGHELRESQILVLLRDRGPLTSYEIADALSIPQATAWRTLEKLEKAGRITQTAASNPQGRRYSLK